MIPELDLNSGLWGSNPRLSPPPPPSITRIVCLASMRALGWRFTTGGGVHPSSAVELTEWQQEEGAPGSLNMVSILGRLQDVCTYPEKAVLGRAASSDSSS